VAWVLQDIGRVQRPTAPLSLIVLTMTLSIQHLVKSDSIAGMFMYSGFPVGWNLAEDVISLLVVCLVPFLLARCVPWKGHTAEIHRKCASSGQRPAKHLGSFPADETDQFQKHTVHNHNRPQNRNALQQHFFASRWNQAIDSAARQGDFDKAVSLLLECENSAAQPDVITYNILIHHWAKTGDLQGAEMWLKRMESRGIQATTCSYNALLDACAKANNVAACGMWLRRMISQGIAPDVLSYSSTIHALSRRGDSAAAEGWFRKMRAAGVEPDAVSYNSMIHACGVQGNPQCAEKWIEEMRSLGLEATTTTYTAIIDACAKCGDVHRAEKWMGRMASDDVEANVITYSAMVDTCAKAGDVTRAEHWLNKMIDSGVAPNAHSYSAVISACAKAGDVEAAERWLEHMEKTDVHSDAVVYSTVIDACGKVRDANRAMAVFKRMLARGIKPHIVAYAALARPFAYNGEWTQVENIAAKMKQHGVEPNEYFVYTQLLAYGSARRRQVERAERYFRDAMNGGIKANDHIFSALAKSVGYARARKLVKEFRSLEEAPVMSQRHDRDHNGGRMRGKGSGACIPSHRC